MDVLGVRQMKTSTKKHSKRSKSKKDFKVVYISTPMKVETCASEFRALVQELTGKDSDVADRFMDKDNVRDDSPTTSRDVDDDRRVHDHGLPLANSNHGSVFESFDDGLMYEGSFLGMFTSNLLHAPPPQLSFGSSV